MYAYSFLKGGEAYWREELKKRRAPLLARLLRK